MDARGGHAVSQTCAKGTGTHEMRRTALVGLPGAGKSLILYWNNVMLGDVNKTNVFDRFHQ